MDISTPSVRGTLGRAPSLSNPSIRRTSQLIWQPRQPGRLILLLNEFEKNIVPGINFFNEGDGVQDYVDSMLVHANYWRATNSSKLWILDGLNSNMTISVRDAATVYNQMGSRLLPEIEHELRAWMHFHNRIVEVVAGKFPHRTPNPTTRC